MSISQFWTNEISLGKERFQTEAFTKIVYFSSRFQRIFFIIKPSKFSCDNSNLIFSKTLLNKDFSKKFYLDISVL